jgi:tRNA A-37 threonylcarbamoyl transferase component Bud32
VQSDESGDRELLSPATVGPFLAQRGLVPEGATVVARELGGGVSNVVLAVTVEGRAMVVKQAMPRLRVQDEWLATRERAISEAEALRVALRLTPGAVPEVLDVDRGACVVTIGHAPVGWRNWKEDLLAGDVDPAVAGRLGELLAVWHGATHGDVDLARRFGDLQAFDQLRIDPYYRTSASRRPELAEAIGEALERMSRTQVCLVHGDYSPKNVLVGDGVWVLDFEVAHYGDPAFDLAFMLNHLLLKQIHRPALASELAGCARAFWDAYRAGMPAGLVPETPYVLAHLGCLMVARVDGKSPAEYLAAGERERARALGSCLLLEPPASLDAALALARCGGGR